MYIASAVKDSVINLKDGMSPKSFWQYFGAVANDTTYNFEKDFSRSEKLIRARLKATIGRNLFETGMSYRVINSTVNNTFTKALEVMTSITKFEVLKPKANNSKQENKKATKEKEGATKKIKIVTKDKEK